MKNGFVFIDDDNREDFYSVFPEDIELGRNRVAIACVDELGRILGAVSYVFINYQYDIDWIFVPKDMRGRGIGKSLLEMVLLVLDETDDYFPISARFEFSPQNAQVYSLFISCEKFYTTYSHDRYYISAGDLAKASVIHKRTDGKLSIRGFFELPMLEQRRILDFLSANEEYTVEDYEKWKEACVPELCLGIYSDGELADLIFVQKGNINGLELAFLYSKFPAGLFELLSNAVEEKERLFPDADLTFETVNEEAARIANRVFPRSKPVPVYEAVS
ncbi:MAG: GNAT family N-acetyltransferase [Lachnospiraceae bacterium]|nr:GNAT family N-acetyltransferase [Lachnospiraceae bacterium]